jgi:hypothetical protein
MNLHNPYSLTFSLVFAATIAVGTLETWGALVQERGFDPLLALSMSLMLIPLYILKKRSDQSNEASSCRASAV